VAGVGINADGSRLATAGADKTARVWSLAPPRPGVKAEEEKPVAQFKLPGRPEGVTLSPNGSRVAVAVAEKDNHPIRVFDVASARELQVIPDHTGAIHTLAFASDNRSLVSASKDKTALISDVGVTRVIEAHDKGVTAVQFHNNGTLLLSAGADKTVKLWDPATGKLQRTFVPLDDPVSAAVFSRDCTQVAAAAGKVVKVWNAADGKELKTLAHPARVTSLSFSVDKTKLVTGAADKVARIWDLATGKELQFFSQGDAVRAVVFRDNNTVISGSADKSLTVSTVSITRAISAGKKAIRGLTLVPFQTHLLTAGADQTVKLWNINNGNSERTYEGAEKAVGAVAVSRNNVLVAAGGADKIVRVYNYADAKLLGSFKVGATIRSLAFSPNNQTLAAVCADNSLITWNVVYNQNQPAPADFGKKLQTFTHAKGATDVVFAPDNVTLYSGGKDKTVKSWKVALEAPTKNFPHPNHVDAVAFNSTGTLLATGCHDGILRIFDVAKGQQLKQVNAHVTPNNTGIYCLAWSPDDKQIVTGSIDYSLKLWDANTGAMVREFKPYKEKVFEKGHDDSVYCVAFSPDGKNIASGGAERLIKLWNVADGSVIRDFVNPKIKVPAKSKPQSHPGWVYSLRFTKNGKHLVSVGDSRDNKGYLAVWTTATGKPVHAEEMAFGAFYGVAISPDGKTLALGGGPKGREDQELNKCYIIKMPATEKK
jgi:WD40 repeat protein